MTDTGTKPRTERHVEYGEQVVLDELPGRPQKASPIQDVLNRLKDDESKHGKWVGIAKYTNGSAATAAANVERKRRGQDASISGWEFATRRVDNGEATLLFAKFDPKAIKGSPEERHQRHQGWIEEREARAAEKRAEREKAPDAKGQRPQARKS